MTPGAGMLDFPAPYGQSGAMNGKVKETREQWDDVPAKVVGRRRKGMINLEKGDGFLRLGVDMGVRLSGRAKGVHRYRSHEEAGE